MLRACRSKLTVPPSHRFTAIGYTVFIAVLVVQWAILVNGFYFWVLNRSLNGIVLDFPSFITALFCAGSVLISFGVWIGKIGPEQLLFMGLAQTLFYCTNSYIIEGVLHVRDVGGTVSVCFFWSCMECHATHLVAH